MSHNLCGRLDRLERRQEIKAHGLPPQFWDALTGAILLAHLDADTRRLIEPLLGGRPERTAADEIEERIREARIPQAE
jgi:hypothetical protein